MSNDAPERSLAAKLHPKVYEEGYQAGIESKQPPGRIERSDDDFMRLAEFGCFTGDCPHIYERECAEAVRLEYLRQHKCIQELEVQLAGWVTSHSKNTDHIDQQAKRIEALEALAEQFRLAQRSGPRLNRLEKYERLVSELVALTRMDYSASPPESSGDTEIADTPE